jgi:hypothetical protein
MGSLSRSGVYFGIMTVVLLSICDPARGADSSSCISALSPCVNYLNATKPPDTCCTPLVSEYTTNKACLCSLLNQTALIQQLHINVTQAEELPVRCGLNASASSCSNLNGTTSGSPPPPNSTSRKSAASSSSFEILPLIALLLLGVIVQVYQ